MQTYDMLMLAVLATAAIFGAIKGFAWQIASIASITVSYWVALKFREPFSQQINADPPWNRFLAMFILYVGTAIAIWILFRMISGTIDRFKLREFDLHVGAVFGLAKGVIYCILITMFSVALLGDNIRQKIVQSRSGYYITKALDHSDKIMPEEIHEVVRPYLDQFDQRLRDAGESKSSPADLIPNPQKPWESGINLGDQLLQTRTPAEPSAFR